MARNESPVGQWLDFARLRSRHPYSNAGLQVSCPPSLHDTTSDSHQQSLQEDRKQDKKREKPQVKASQVCHSIV